ncbi:MAG: hypothetical protein I3273_00760 [Candidatus Moeniiplasma glomeromycotorum]|nr:hypothetical protein [Candidatus Moeniiplasma glomeromycotorum]MCE8167346.1 hypothetical protein [Candidatus Moeniiplasma glomeromycotorum]MCE8168641.1 hypothetical protein [Candidatus Moeniiplasma glomeromycotorum]
MVTIKKAQEWLNSEKADKNTPKIEISKEIELEGELIIENYPNLQVIDLNGGKGLTKVTIKDCPQVEVLRLFGNKITEIVGYDQLPKLKEFNFAKNQIIGVVDISKNSNIENLVAHSNQNAKIEGWETLKDIRFLSIGFVGKDISKNIIFSPFDERKKELTEIAKKFGIEEDKIKDKSPGEIKQLIQDESDKNQQNKNKINQELPGLLEASGKIDDNKLSEIKKGIEKVEPLKEIIKATGIDPESKNAKEEAESLKKLSEDLKTLGIDKNKIGLTISKYEEVIRSIGEEYLTQIQAELKQL